MAKIVWVEDRLLTWAQVCTTGSDGEGFPGMSVLHKDWSPPAPGSTPTMRTSNGLDLAKQTHACIAGLSDKLARVLFVHYCMRLSVELQQAELGCSKATLFARIDRAHRALSLGLPR